MKYSQIYLISIFGTVAQCCSGYSSCNLYWCSLKDHSFSYCMNAMFVGKAELGIPVPQDKCPSFSFSVAYLRGSVLGPLLLCLIYYSTK
jgi:hypothetical protein